VRFIEVTNTSTAEEKRSIYFDFFPDRRQQHFVAKLSLQSRYIKPTTRHSEAALKSIILFFKSAT
jgi:hypothetical protein